MREAVESVVHENKLLAIIIRSEYRKNGIEFFTPNDFSQQLAYMNRPAEIPHKECTPKVYTPKEYLIGILDRNTRICYAKANCKTEALCHL